MDSRALHNVHVLIVDRKVGNAKLLRDMLLSLGLAGVEVAEDTACALDVLRSADFDAIFCDEAVGPLDVFGFAVAVRRRRGLRNPVIPIVMISDGPQRAQVERARDAGVNDLLVRPLSTNAVSRKLLALLTAPKLFVQTQAFCGPNRRRERAAAGAGKDAATSSGARHAGKFSRRRTDRAAPKA